MKIAADMTHKKMEMVGLNQLWGSVYKALYVKLLCQDMSYFETKFKKKNEAMQTLSRGCGQIFTFIRRLISHLSTVTRIVSMASASL